jgi:hypothetical protein
MDPTAILGTAGQREKFMDLEQSDRTERATSAGKYPLFKPEKETPVEPPTAEQLNNVAKVLGIRPSQTRIKLNGKGTPSPAASAPSVTVPAIASVRSVTPPTEAEIADRRTRALEGLKEFEEHNADEHSGQGTLDPVLEA